MTDKDETAATIGPERRTPERRTWSGARRHDQAVIQAEVRRLARALRPGGVVPRDAGERSARAPYWTDDGLDPAAAD
jgi:hypothetical protein